MRTVSRRHFLAAAGLLAAPRIAVSQSNTKPLLAYIGTYSNPLGPEGSPGHGQGIYLFEIDRATAALTERALFPNPFNPSWLAFHPSRTYLYSGNETPSFEGRSGSVSAYAVDGATGQLSPINTVSSHGAGPAYVSVHPSGKFVLVANYAGGTIAVLPIGAQGELGAATDVHEDQGAIAGRRPTSGPPGSFALSGHDRPHAHMILPDAAGNFVFHADLGLDRIFIWKFDAEKGRLLPNSPDSVSVPAGDGPRHFVFHPNGRVFYSLQEESSTIVTYDYEPARGTLASRGTVSTLPKGFGGTNYTSEIAIAPGARYLYAANRLHDSIAWFAISRSGDLTLAGEEPTRGDYPRSFTIDPAGTFLFCCNQRGDAVTSFRIDPRTGALSFTGQYTPLGTPAMILFLNS
ncbi:MAG TPA: lactonase family protein [Bryobacteraceae bacterium]|nr:lactonase family protein [Bryobacteraceae bacterium]